MFIFVHVTLFPIHTDYHASADITELGFLAVMVFEFVGFVIDTDNGFFRFWFFLLHFHLLLINEIDLDTQQDTSQSFKTQNS